MLAHFISLWDEEVQGGQRGLKDPGHWEPVKVFEEREEPTKNGCVRKMALGPRQVQVGQVRVGGGVGESGNSEPIAVIQGRGDEVRALAGWGLWEQREEAAELTKTWDYWDVGSSS